MHLLYAWLMSRIDQRSPDRERGDVPGWVMVTVVTGTSCPTRPGPK